MTEYEVEPLEESPEVAAAVDDDTTVPQLADQGPTEDIPEFHSPVTGHREGASADETAAGRQSP